jgi:tol-pal system protein YbgF
VKTRYRIAGVSALALGVAMAVAATQGAGAPQAPLSRYIAPHAGNFVRVAGLFGESDEEKEARLQHEQNQDDATNKLNEKVRDLEDTVRSLTGTNEELSHRIAELSDKIDRQQKDFEYRLCALAAQQLGASTGQGDSNAVPCPGAGATSFNGPPPASSLPPLGNQSSQGGNGGNGGNGEIAQHLAPPPGVLGTLPVGADRAAAPAANSDTRAQFSNAMNLLAKARYDEASAAFRNFADTYPKDDLASQAVYWVGDIAYVQKDYANAARSFAEVIKKYPTSLRAPDSMLKLGQSLIAAGQKKEGCTALAALPDKYPKAAKAVLSQGADARKAVCRGNA